MSGLSTTLSLWSSLFTLLQDDDQDVRAAASDFISMPAPLLSSGTHRLLGYRFKGSMKRYSAITKCTMVTGIIYTVLFLWE